MAGNRIPKLGKTQNTAAIRAGALHMNQWNLECDEKGCTWKAGPFKSEGSAAVMWKVHLKTHGRKP